MSSSLGLGRGFFICALVMLSECKRLWYNTLMQEPKKSNENQQQFAEVYSPNTVAQKSFLKQAGIIVGGLLILVGIVSSILLATGIMKLSFSSTSNSLVSGSRVCNSDIVTRYNGIIGSSVKSEADRDAVYANIKKLSDEVQSKDNYETDPTCLYINFVTAVNDANADKAVKYANQIDSLANKGVFIDTRLIGVISTTQLKGTAESLSSPNDDTQERG